MKLNPYITFPGTAGEALNLYKKVFNTEPEVQRFKDVPPIEGMPPMTPEGGERVLHAMFKVGNDLLMISDAPEGQDDSVVSGSQTHISVHPESKEEADRIFVLLSEGGSSIMPMEIQFWGDYFGMCRDRFGVEWMINFSEEN
jgi:PhnB protein